MKSQKLPSGNYRAQLVVGKDAGGKRIVKSFTRSSAWEAEKAALDYKAKYGVGAAVHELTVRAAITQYITVHSYNSAQSTKDKYIRIRDTRLQGIMEIRITDLSVKDVQLAVNIDSARLGAKSIKDSVDLLCAVLSYHDVELRLKKKIVCPRVRRKIKTLAPALAVINIVKGTKFELACLLAMWLSLRIGEVRGLRYSDIMESGQFLAVQREIVYTDGKDVLNDYNKTDISTRVIPLPQTLYKMITAQSHKSDDEYIVPLGYNCIYKAVKELMAKIGYADMSFHNLRAVFASNLHAMGIPDKYIQSLGGWSNPTTMYRHYIRPLTTEEQKYQQQIDSYFAGLLDKAE
ncbi:Phage integrase family protein [Ruminococcaceae bacterium FB2012]|nr:Phage integrase family protein [Ruminococcaceae bacterium FB2012]